MALIGTDWETTDSLRVAEIYVSHGMKPETRARTDVAMQSLNDFPNSARKRAAGDEGAPPRESAAGRVLKQELGTRKIVPTAHSYFSPKLPGPAVRSVAAPCVGLG